jgi:hypothetical protein
MRRVKIIRSGPSLGGRQSANQGRHEPSRVFLVLHLSVGPACARVEARDSLFSRVRLWLWGWAWFGFVFWLMARLPAAVLFETVSDMPERSTSTLSKTAGTV